MDDTEQTIIPHSAALHLEAEVVGEVGRLHQYGGLWAIRENDGVALWNRIRGTDLAAHIEAARQPAGETVTKQPRYTMLEGGVAVVSMAGVMTKYGSSMAMMREGTLGVRKALRQANADKEVSSIVLRIDSPGGSVSGTGELADDVARIKKKKPVYAFIEDLGASAAYWVASQATAVTANKDALVGSIGTYMVVDDYSGFYAKEGIKTHVIRAGKYKGAGVQGSEITAEQLTNWQSEVEAINQGFVDAVARGRGMAREVATDLADGRVHTAAAAKKLGLIDAVGTLDEVINGAGGKAGGLLFETVADCPSPEKVAAAAAMEKESSMSDAKDGTSVQAAEKKSPGPATLKELKAAMPKAGNDFLVACMEADMTLDQAKATYTQKIETDLAEKSAEVEKLRTEAAKGKATEARSHGATKGAVGVDPARDGGAAGDAGGEDPIMAWNKAVDEEFAKTKDRARAVSNVVRKQPDLHKAYIEAVNGRKAR